MDSNTDFEKKLDYRYSKMLPNIPKLDREKDGMPHITKIKVINYS